MKKVILYTSCIATEDTGDEIAYEGCLHVIKELFPEAFRILFATHTPVPLVYNLKFFRDVGLKFACGTNIMDSNMFRPYRQWDVTLLNAWHTGPVVLLGVGWRFYMGNPNFYTRLVYKNLLSKEHLHSVRDDYTLRKMQAMGFKNVINTSCPTMWKLTEEHCSKIPRKKAENVLCTLTEFKKDPERDKRFMEILKENYKRVIFWVQAMKDYDYLQNELGAEKGVEILAPGLDNFDRVLTSDMDLDYVGTRLHGGIRALQKGRRTFIIGIDNRAAEKKRDFNLNVFERSDIERLPEAVHQEVTTSIIVPTENIKKWKDQFRKFYL